MLILEAKMPPIVFSRIVRAGVEIATKREGVERLVVRNELPLRVPVTTKQQWQNDLLVISCAFAVDRDASRIAFIKIDSIEPGLESSIDKWSLKGSLVTISIGGEHIASQSVRISLSCANWLGFNPQHQATLYSFQAKTEQYKTFQNGSWKNIQEPMLPSNLHMTSDQSMFVFAKNISNGRDPLFWGNLVQSPEWIDISLPEPPSVAEWNVSAFVDKQFDARAVYNWHEVYARWSNRILRWTIEPKGKGRWKRFRLLRYPFVLVAVEDGIVRREYERYLVNQAPFRASIINMVNLKTGEITPMCSGILGLPL